MTNLKKLRNSIEKVDKRLCRQFEKRMKISKQIGSIKKENNLPIEDKNREEILINKNLQFIKDENIKDYYKKLINVIIDMSKDIQSK